MIDAAKEEGSSKTTLPGQTRALWAWLCLIVAFCLAGTRAEAFFAEHQPAPGQNAPLHSEAIGQNYDGSQYDAPDSLLAAKRVAGAADDVAIQFGKNANQVQHAFRHTDALRLDRAVVQSGVQTHLKTVASQITPGKPFNQIIEVGGQRIQYTAFKLQDGTINVGRIHGAP